MVGFETNPTFFCFKSIYYYIRWPWTSGTMDFNHFQQTKNPKYGICKCVQMLDDME
jgi:hypothetical protein